MPQFELVTYEEIFSGGKNDTSPLQTWTVVFILTDVNKEAWTSQNILEAILWS